MSVVKSLAAASRTANSMNSARSTTGAWGSGSRSASGGSPRVARFASVPVKTIYGARSHYRPFRDTWITSWLSVWYKTLDSDAS